MLNDFDTDPFGTAPAAAVPTPAPRPAKEPKACPLIYAIDPGSEKSGWVLFEGLRVVDSGTHDNHDLLRWIREGQGAAFLALEMAESFGAPVWSQVFTTVRWTGRFQEAWAKPDEVVFVTRSQVKLELLGRRAGTDQLIRQALLDRVGVPGTKKSPGPTHGVSSHAWAALAVAVTAQEQLRKAAP